MIERYSRQEMNKIWSEENKFAQWLKVEIAVVEAWGKLGKIPKQAVINIKNQANFDLKRINEIEKEVNHDVIAFLTSVAEKVGPDSRFIHLGLTSSDVVDTALNLQLKEALNLIADDLKKFLSVLEKQAFKFRNVLMMGRTHGMHAEPITFGLKLALYYEEIKRNLNRLLQAIDVISVGKISGAVGTFAHAPIELEEIVCQQLGLKPDKVSNQIIQRDRIAQVLMTLAILAGSLEKIATEVRSLQRTEIGEVEEPFTKGQKGSSAMPHKKNPILCERICGLARVIRGYALASLENIALWNERDISHSSAERIILPDATILIDYMLSKITWIIENLKVYPERMQENLELTKGVFFSQKVLLALVEAGITREEAYKIVQKEAHRALAEGKEFKNLLLKNQKVKKYLKQKEIENLFDIKKYLKNVKLIFKRVFEG